MVWTLPALPLAHKKDATEQKQQLPNFAHHHRGGYGS